MSHPLSQLGLPSKYGLTLNRLNVRTIYSKRRHLGALFLLNFFNDKINCRFTLDTHGLILPINQIRNLSVFAVSNIPRFDPSASWSTAVNKLCRFFFLFLVRVYALSPLSTIVPLFILFSLLRTVKFSLCLYNYLFNSIQLVFIYVRT
jgi:hypothetical protein